MQLDKFTFVFGYRFLKEINKQHMINRNGVGVRAGLETVLPNLVNGDVETLMDALLIANKTETPRATVSDLEQIIGEAEDISQLFDEVLEAMEESNFTKEKTKNFLEAVRGNPKKK